LNKKHPQHFLWQKSVFFWMTCFPTPMSLEMLLDIKPLAAGMFSFGMEKLTAKEVVKSNC
jgi:hypothetical protein